MNEYYDYFGPDYKLDVRSSNMEDRNSIEYLERIKNVVMEHLREIGGPPSVQMSGACCPLLFIEHCMPALMSESADIPRVPIFDDVDLNETEDMSNPNERPRSTSVSRPTPCCHCGHRTITDFMRCNYAPPKTCGI